MRRIGVLVPLVLLAACATRNEVSSAPSDSGVGATYAAPFDKVRMACRDAIGEISFGMREDRAWEGRWRILATHGLTSDSAGRIVRIIVTPDPGDASATVHVLVRSKIDSRENAALDEAFAGDLHRKIAARVAK